MVRHLKAELRKRLRMQRDSLSPAEAKSMNAAIAARLLGHMRFREAQTIGFYIAKGSEADLWPAIEVALKAGKRVCAPATDHSIRFYEFKSRSDLIQGKYGILEPKGGEPIEPELVLVPGMAFGLCMHRIGYGKGYYDSYLAKSFAYRIGICYDFQLLDKLPSHGDDQRMDDIITDRRVITL